MGSEAGPGGRIYYRRPPSLHRPFGGGSRGAVSGAFRRQRDSLAFLSKGGGGVRRNGLSVGPGGDGSAVSAVVQPPRRRPGGGIHHRRPSPGRSDYRDQSVAGPRLWFSGAAEVRGPGTQAGGSGAVGRSHRGKARGAAGRRDERAGRRPTGLYTQPHRGLAGIHHLL